MMKWVKLVLGRIISLKEWTVVRANVEGLGGEPINGSDRIVVGFLPADIDQNARVQPLDLLRYRQGVLGTFTPSFGVLEDVLDTDRNGMINPLDLLRLRQLLLGTPPATQVWAGQTMGVTNPVLWPECCR